MSSILALTLHPEWAWAITHLGKDAENRSERFCRQIDRRVGDGWLAIHAGVKRPADFAAVAAMYDGQVDAFPGDADDPSADPGWLFGGRSGVFITDADLPRGAIVALAKISDVLEPGAGAPWKVLDSAALALSPVVVLPEPIACKGKQGLWTPPPDVQARLRATLKSELRSTTMDNDDILDDILDATPGTVWFAEEEGHEWIGGDYLMSIVRGVGTDDGLYIGRLHTTDPLGVILDTTDDAAELARLLVRAVEEEQFVRQAALEAT